MLSRCAVLYCLPFLLVVFGCDRLGQSIDGNLGLSRLSFDDRESGLACEFLSKVSVFI